MIGETRGAPAAAVEGCVNMDAQMKDVLLLTATVTPPAGVPLLTRTDPNQRLQDYADALRFYLPLIGATFDSIVFAENSDSDISMLEAIVAGSAMARQVEFLSFNGLDHPASRGRGYGEFKLVDHVMQRAAAVAGDVCVWKCTGRYVLKNIAQLVGRRPDVDLYCHCRDYPQRLCELSVMSFNRRGYKAAIEGVYEKLRNDVTPGVHSNEEIAFRAVVDHLPAHIKVKRRFNTTPIIQGVRGWNNADYSGPWAPKIMLRRAAQKVAPWIWI